MPKRNISHEKAMFLLRAKHFEECVTTFARALNDLADVFNFTNKNEEIKDRFIRLHEKGTPLA